MILFWKLPGAQSGSLRGSWLLFSDWMIIVAFRVSNERAVGLKMEPLSLLRTPDWTENCWKCLVPVKESVRPEPRQRVVRLAPDFSSRSAEFTDYSERVGLPCGGTWPETLPETTKRAASFRVICSWRSATSSGRRDHRSARRAAQRPGRPAAKEDNNRDNGSSQSRTLPTKERSHSWWFIG